MKKSIRVLLSFSAVLASVLIGCSDGPSGPHPVQELTVIYDIPPATGLQLTLSARMIIHGDSTIMQEVPMRNDTVLGTSLMFSASPISGSTSPTLQLNFEKLPTKPGTYAFTAAKVVVGIFGLTPTSPQGAFVNYGGNLYAPVSGSIVLTEVATDGVFVYGYTGYVNGQLQAMFPKGFKPTSSDQPYPPGFSLSNPTLVGDKLTIHSAKFTTRSRLAIPINNQVD